MLCSCPLSIQLGLDCILEPLFATRLIDRISGRLYRSSHLLTYKTKTADRDVEYEERIDRNADPVLDHTRTTQNAHTCSQGPCNEHQVHWYPGNSRETQCAEHSSDDQREQSVADDANGLKERTSNRGGFVSQSTALHFGTSYTPRRNSHISTE
jgi:hypothetical protein